MSAIGSRIPKYDGRGHVTGHTRYVDDVRVPGITWVKALRSPHDSAEILSLDTADAERFPGVHAVVTHRDVPRNLIGMLEPVGVPADEPMLAATEVRYRGQPVAAVSADTEAIAQQAIDRIRVSYRVRPALLDVRLALDPDAPRLTDDGNLYKFDPYYERRVRRGDVDRAFAEAYRVIMGVYRPHAIEHAPTETQVALAVPTPDGRLELYSVTQGMYFTLGMLSDYLQIPYNRIKLYGGTVGGGFGGKVDCAAEGITSLLALKTGRPTKWRWTREEEMLYSSTRAAWHMEIADAVSKDGFLLGRRTMTLHDAGAYNRLSPYGTAKHTYHLGGAYTIPNVAFNSYVAWTNRVPSTSMRGFGVTSASFAVETQMERIADELGIDPWELRLKNASRIGDLTPTRVTLEDPSAIMVLQEAARQLGVELPAALRTMTNAPRTAAELLDYPEFAARGAR